MFVVYELNELLSTALHLECFQCPAILEIVDESPGMLDENLVGVVVRLFISV